MAVKKVLLIGNPDLRKTSTDIKFKDSNLKKIIDDLSDTLTYIQKTEKTGRAIAAPQIGYFKNVVVSQLPDKKIIMINPKIIWKSKKMFDVWDSCFCFKIAFFVKIKRHQKIKIKYQNEHGKLITKSFKDDLSELFQHEIDHLYGILATDHLKNNKNIIMREEFEKLNQNN